MRVYNNLNLVCVDMNNELRLVDKYNLGFLSLVYVDMSNDFFNAAFDGTDIIREINCSCTTGRFLLVHGCVLEFFINPSLYLRAYNNLFGLVFLFNIMDEHIFILKCDAWQDNVELDDMTLKVSAFDRIFIYLM